MRPIDDPSFLTPDERLSEVAGILAAGVLRLHARAALSGDDSGQEISPDSGPAGHRDFVCLIGSDEGHATDMLESIKTELDGNELLLADFPEVCYPIQCLDGIANRCSGQLYNGQRTHIGWTAKDIVLPTIPGSKASGAIIKVAGITGRIRGMKYKRADGQSVRPLLVVIDDP